MEMQEPITKIAFRFWDNEVVAVMPYLPGTNDKFDCTGYVHNGQHTAVDPILAVSKSRPATVAEYTPLLQELERIGYRVQVIKRINQNVAVQARQAQIANA